MTGAALVTALLPLGVALADDVNEPTFFSAQVDQGQFGTGVVGNGTFLGGQFSSPNGSGVSTSSNGKGAGISANSRDGLGGEFSGKQPPVRLVPAATAGPPAAASGAHQAGELYVDSAGQLFICIAAGTPGTEAHQALRLGAAHPAPRRVLRRQPQRAVAHVHTEGVLRDDVHRLAPAVAVPEGGHGDGRPRVELDSSAPLLKAGHR